MCNFTIEEFGKHECPDKIRPGNLRDHYRNGLCNPAVLAVHPSHPLPQPLDLISPSLPPAKIGLEGVYHYISSFEDEIFGPETYDEQRFRIPAELEFFKTIYALGCTASYHSPKDFYLRSVSSAKYLAQTIATAHFHLKQLWKLKVADKDRKYRRELREAKTFGKKPVPIPERISAIHRKAKCYTVAGSLIICPQNRNYCYVFNQNDLNRLESIIIGFATARFTPFQEGRYEEADVKKYANAITKYQQIVIDAMGRVNGVQAQSLCRALDVVYHIHLADLSSDIDRRAIQKQWDKWKDEKLEQIIPAEDLLRLVRRDRLPLQIGLQVLIQYKALPQPDFDYFGAAFRQEELYAKRRKHALESHACEGHQFEELLCYHKWLMLIAYSEAHNRLPGHIRDSALVKGWHQQYPHLKPERIPFLEVNDIDFNGDFSWIERTTDVIDLLKDKAICPKHVKSIKDSVDMRTTAVHHKNYLMNWACNENAVDLSKMSRETAFYDLKAEDKAEAKKPNGRWFFEAHTDARMLQSQYEESVAFYAEKCPGSVNGVSIATKLTKMAQVARTLPLDGPMTQLLISFDIDKFSPTLLPTVHMRLDEQWAEAFGVPDLLHSHKIFTEGTVHYIKGRIHHRFPKTGADFEGFAGRKLTFYHCAVMGYCIRTLRQANVVTDAAAFACLIDDGALRLKIPRAKLVEKKDIIIAHLENVYNLACLFISWDKTYISSSLMTFLNEVKIEGRSITPFVKSLLKINAKSDKFNPSLVDDLQQLESTCRGAVGSGAPLMLVYSIYCFWVCDLMKKWGPEGEDRKFELQNAWICFAPISIGGLGLTTPLILGGAISHISFIECLGNLKSIAVRFPHLNPQIEILLNSEIEPNTYHVSAYDPLRVKSYATTLRVTRMQKLVEKYFKRKVRNPVLVALLERVQRDDANLVENLLISGAQLPVEVRASLAEMEPARAIETLVSKFLNSNVARQICPRYSLNRVSYAQRSEAKVVLLPYFSKHEFKPRYKPIKIGV